MDQLIPSLQSLLDPLSCCFRAEVFSTFSVMTAAWISCLGRRSVSRVWETTGRSKDPSHCPAFRLFSEAVWNWDEVARIFLVQLITALIPDANIWLVIDDTLCHKRGAAVAFGGIFLDAVLSTKQHKTLRYGNNWVTLGLIVELPFRKDRPFCLNILWRVCSKRVRPQVNVSHNYRQSNSIRRPWQLGSHSDQPWTRTAPSGPRYRSGSAGSTRLPPPLPSTWHHRGTSAS